MAMMDYVDENDRVLGQVSKKEIYAQHLTHRIGHVWIFNDAGELLLQKRGAKCHYCPLHWGVSASGHVDAGETYEQGAQRELNEELGVTLPLTFVSKEFFPDDPRGAKKFVGIFRATSNGPFKIDPEEVDQIKFVTIEKVREMIANGEPFHPQFLAYLDLIVENR